MTTRSSAVRLTQTALREFTAHSPWGSWIKWMAEKLNTSGLLFFFCFCMEPRVKDIFPFLWVKCFSFKVAVKKLQPHQEDFKNCPFSTTQQYLPSAAKQTGQQQDFCSRRINPRWWEVIQPSPHLEDLHGFLQFLLALGGLLVGGIAHHQISGRGAIILGEGTQHSGNPGFKWQSQKQTTSSFQHHILWKLFHFLSIKTQRYRHLKIKELSISLLTDSKDILPSFGARCQTLKLWTTETSGDS